MSAPCTDCCECPTATIQWDTVSASRNKCGAAFEEGVWYLTRVGCTGVEMRRTETRDSFTCISTVEDVDDPACVDPFPEDVFLDEYTTALLRENVLLDLDSLGFDDDWNDTAAAFYSVSSDESGVSARRARYRVRFLIPKTRSGKCYRVNWVERFAPENGVAIDSVTVDFRGVYRPTVSIAPGVDPGTGPEDEIVYGSGAIAVPVMSATGTIVSIRILNPGAGYSSAFPPVITISNAWIFGGTSTGWTATVSSTGQITAITGGSAGNYRPTISFNNGGGTGATAEANMDETGGISSVSLTSAGSGYRIASPPLTLGISPSLFPFGGRMFPNFGTQVAKCAVWDGSTLAGRWVTREPADSGSPLSSIEVVHGGIYKPFVVLTGGGASAFGAKAEVTGFTTDGKVTAITVTDPGTGYTSAPTVTVVRRGAGGTITNSTGWTASISGGVVTGVSGGTEGNYLPTLTISGGGGSGATATVAFDGSNGGTLATVTLTAPGSGFQTNPTLTLSYYGTDTVLLAAHFGTETEYADGDEPPGAVPVGYSPGVVRTYPVLGDSGTAPWKYYEVPVPETNGTTTAVNVSSTCDCTPCP